MSKVADNLALYIRVLLAITELGDGTADCQDCGSSLRTQMARWSRSSLWQMQ